MEQEIKEEIERLKKIKGELRGSGIKEELDFVLKEEGEEGIKKLENGLAELGFSLKRDEIKMMSFYPLSLYAITQFLMKKLFNWNNEKLQEMGRFESKSSLIMRLFMKYFASVETAAEQVSGMWRKYYTVGNLSIVKIDQEDRSAILRLEDFYCHDINCETLKGYFASVVQMVIGKKVECQETKCVHRGDEYHEFLLKW